MFTDSDEQKYFFFNRHRAGADINQLLYKILPQLLHLVITPGLAAF